MCKATIASWLNKLEPSNGFRNSPRSAEVVYTGMFLSTVFLVILHLYYSLYQAALEARFAIVCVMLVQLFNIWRMYFFLHKFDHGTNNRTHFIAHFDKGHKFIDRTLRVLMFVTLILGLKEFLFPVLKEQVRLGESILALGIVLMVMHTLIIAWDANFFRWRRGLSREVEEITKTSAIKLAGGRSYITKLIERLFGLGTAISIAYLPSSEFGSTNLMIMSGLTTAYVMSVIHNSWKKGSAVKEVFAYPLMILEFYKN